MMMSKTKKGALNPYLLLLFFLFIACVVTFIVPAGNFQRETVEGIANPVVVPGTYSVIPSIPVTITTLLGAISQGMGDSSGIIFLIFLSAGSFVVFNETGAIENGIGVLIKRVQAANIHPSLVLWLLTFIFSSLGFVSGPDALIPFTLIAVSISLGLGYDLILGVALVLVGSGVGFAMSPINAAVVGTPQSIIGLPIFSGMGLRTVMWFVNTCVVAASLTYYGKRIKMNPEKSSVKDSDVSGLTLSKELEDYTINKKQISVLVVFVLMFITTVLGSLNFGWYLNEIGGVFLVGGVIAGLMYGMSIDAIIAGFIKGGASVAGTALLIGLARSIQIILTKSNILDTIIHSLSRPLGHLPPVVAGIFITIIVGITHIFIASGSGLSVAMIPIIAPLGIMTGLTPQSTILAYQLGGAVLNVIIPTLGSTMAMIGIARVSYSQWFKVGWKLIVPVILVSWLFLVIAVLIGY